MGRLRSTTINDLLVADQITSSLSARRMSATNSDFDAEDLAFARRVDFDALYERYSRRTFAFLTSLNIRGADAEDVHQKVWMRVLEALRKKTFEGHFRGWLFQITRNSAVDLMRKKQPDSLDTTVAEETISVNHSPDQSMIDAEYQSALANCVGKLEPQQRTIVRFRLAGADYTKISEKMQLSSARAHRIFYDAKKALASCLGRTSVGGQA